MKNILFFAVIALSLFSVQSLNAQSLDVEHKCDSLSESVYMAVEISPILNTPLEVLESKINSLIPQDGVSLVEGDAFFVMFVVDCKGRTVNYTTQRVKDDAFARKVIECLRLSTQWTPGFQRGKPVDVGFTLAFKLVAGKIRMLPILSNEDDSPKKRKWVSFFSKSKA
jgi:hypothetical protein